MHVQVSYNSEARLTTVHYYRENVHSMKSLLFVLTALVAVVTAEKYAIVFGAAHGWSNYPVYSVCDWYFAFPVADLPYGG